MRSTITVGLGAAVLATGLTVAGAVAPAYGPVGRLARALVPTSSAALAPFDGCDELLQWYVDRALEEVGPWGWGGGRMVPMAVEDSMRAATSSPGAAVTNGSTGTNTQESGVDEPDSAKTDGRLVVRLVDDRQVVLTDVTGTSPRDVATWQLPEGTFAQDLLLVDDHVLVTSSRPVAMMAGRVAPDFPVLPQGTTLTDLDVSDPDHPAVASTTTWTGSRVSMREQAGVVRLVTSTGLPSLPFVHPEVGRLGEKAALERNRSVVRHSRIEDWLPGVESGGRSRPAVDCHDVLHPTTAPDRQDRDTLVVATFRPGAVDAASTVGVTAGGDDVYSSTDRLYVTATDWGARRATTRVHAFALDADGARYVASGAVDGSIRDHWSLDEHDGRLRVAVAHPGPDGSTGDNGVVVLREDGDRLVQEGSVRGLGRGEQIQSVRWFDDLAVLVTFRRVDPLYTVDLADPARPRPLGALEVPGFSSYLHPVGDDRVLGLGTAADAGGTTLGAQAAVFDLRDPTDVRRLDDVRLGGPDSHLGAAEDPHAFTWLPGAQAAVTSLTDWSTSDAGRVLLLRVSPAGTLSVRDLPSPGGYAVRALPLDGDRVALVGDRVVVTSVR